LLDFVLFDVLEDDEEDLLPAFSERPML
jgi:hypothetical protein